MSALTASTGASGPALASNWAVCWALLAWPMTNSTLPRFFWASARRFRMGVISCCERPQLRSAGLPAMTVQIRTFEPAEPGGPDASFPAAR